MAQNIQLFGPRGGFLTNQWIILGNKLITDKYYDEAKMRTRQKRVATDNWRSLGCRNQSSRQIESTFNITAGVKHPKHVFIYLQRTAQSLNQDANPHILDTFRINAGNNNCFLVRQDWKFEMASIFLK